MKKTVCPVCESTVGEDWPRSGLRHCYMCGHLWQREVKPFKYGKDYVANYATRPTVALSWVRLTFLYLYAREAKTVLDIGYGDGEFIRQAAQAGLCALGYDAHGEDIGVPTVKEIGPGFDVVTMFDSFEHMPDLSTPFAAQPSLFVVTIPWRPKDVSDEKILTWRHYKPDEHLHYFSARSIEKIFLRHGYEWITQAAIEDIIRKNPDCDPNTMTFIFRKVMHE